ncbi:MAG TPA: shikimate kinase [Candidatus Dorea intestinavium]|nr:shikimate kinase [Candidatus Dorea intestinavium]
MNKKNNIILIGMPTSGKSTIGVVLAKKIGFDFIDTDLLIQKEENRLLSEIIEEEGIEAFLSIENRVNKNIQGEQSVIAPGGSVVYCQEAMEHFKKIGTIIYLEVPYYEIEKRLANAKNRGVVLKENQSLKDLYEERVPLFKRYANMIINEENLEISETIEEIIERLNITEILRKSNR